VIRGGAGVCAQGPVLLDEPVHIMPAPVLPAPAALPLGQQGQQQPSIWQHAWLVPSGQGSVMKPPEPHAKLPVEATEDCVELASPVEDCELLVAPPWPPPEVCAAPVVDALAPPLPPPVPPPHAMKTPGRAHRIPSAAMVQRDALMASMVGGRARPCRLHFAAGRRRLGAR
jgi:hypothetical protein